jgi:flagellar hook-basal body complex protein FliE
MIQGVGTSGLAQAAIEAALRKVAQDGAKVDEQASRAFADAARAATSGASESALARGVSEVDAAVRQADALPIEMLAGKVTDFHEIAGRIKQAEIAFKFSLEIRNKLIDAYRETMRMSV